MMNEELDGSPSRRDTAVEVLIESLKIRLP